MRKTYLYGLDHAQFRSLVGSGESGLAERLMRRQRDSGEPLGEAALDDLDELLRGIERRGNVQATGDRKTDNLLNLALWLLAEEAGLNSDSGSAGTAVYDEAREALGREGWFSRPMLEGNVLGLFSALATGRVYGSHPPEAWRCDTVTCVLDAAEVRALLTGLRAAADARGSKLPPAVQDLLDQHVFPSLEAAGRAQMGLLAVTRTL